MILRDRLTYISKRYRRITRLSGSEGSINCLTFSRDAEVLASGGMFISTTRLKED
jgi:hypothetical protein